MPNMNVRSVLEYVPYFRDRLFVIHIDKSLLEARELVDSMLDCDTLHEIGVRLIIISEGRESRELQDLALQGEMHTALAEQELRIGASSIARIKEIINRRQVAIVSSGCEGRFAQPIITLLQELKAHKYICLQDGDVPCRDGQPIFAMLESEVAAAAGCSNHEVLLKAAAICRLGIPRVHMLDGRQRGVLLDELFSEEGVGSMVHADSYQEMRKLQVDDIPELLSMISRSVANAQLVQRSYESILAEIESYYVYTLDESIVGSIAIYPYEEEECAELGCLFIKHNYEGHGYGRAMCSYVEMTAREMGFKRLFALSSSAVAYFRDRLNYKQMPRTDLPTARLAKLESSGRESEIFGCELI